MFPSRFFPWFLVATPLFAAASPTPRTTTACQTVMSGNLSPNGVSGNFRLVNDMLAFDPTYLAAGFDVYLQTCESSVQVAGATAAGQLVLASTGQCLTVQDAQQGSVVKGVDCTEAGGQLSATWAMKSGFLYSAAGLGSADCPAGLYGYQAVSSSGNPAAVQKAPVNLACSTGSSVFPFSILM